MKRPLIKISNDEAPANVKPIGKYRDEQGHVLHGVYIQESENFREKLYISDGHLLENYLYPKIDAQFSSPYVNDYNLHLCGGWTFPGVQEYECLTRVVEGKKLMGFPFFFNDESYHQWLEYCANSGLPFKDVLHKRGNGNAHELGIARPEPLGQLLDIEALQRDYWAYEDAYQIKFSEIGGEWAFCARMQIEEELFKISDALDEMKTKKVSDYLNMDYFNKKTVVQLMQVGLLLGYPIETTVPSHWGNYLKQVIKKLKKKKC